jgi:hypothetical protein
MEIPPIDKVFFARVKNLVSKIGVFGLVVLTRISLGPGSDRFT